MPRPLDFDTFCENLDEITTTKIVNKKKFHPNGLFSEQIFGPLKNYTCQCDIYHGVSKLNSKCDLCGVDIVNSDERRKRFAKITLPIYIINPLFYDLIISLEGGNLKSAIDNLMKNENSVLYMDGDDHIVTTTPENIPAETQKWEKIEAIYKLVSEVAKNRSEEGLNGWDIIYNNIDKLVTKNIIVLPPDLRPASKGVRKNNQVVDKINRFYMQILTKKESMKETYINIIKDKNLYYTYAKQLQKDVNELYQHILEKMSKKEGLIRGNILGKRIDFSGRAVIVPDPTLKLDECVLPYKMILEIFKLPISKRLIEISKFKLLNKAITFVDKCIEENDPTLFEVCKNIVKDEVCILNRQPSLHRLGMLGFNIKISLDSVIKIHPLACSPYNADFDGDQMAVYIPISEQTKQEVRDKMFITKNLNSPANGKISTVPTQDIVLGIYALTSGQIPSLNENVMYKGMEKKKFEVVFNKCLPDDYPFMTGSVDIKKLLEIINDINDTYTIEETMITLDNIKKEGFKYSTLFGTTMSLDDFLIEDKSIIEDLYSGTILEQLNRFSDKSLTEKLRDSFKYAYMIDSGARGSWDQVKQMILTRGFISNFDGEILEEPIKHSLVDGLNEKEFFNSTYGCRKGLLDVALNTGISGYLSRKLIFACVNLELDEELDDCGTKDCLEVFIRSERKARMLINRYFYNDLDELQQITKENFKDIIGKIINIRSPIFCTEESICHKCYGDSYKKLNSKYIGIIAAQTLGERGTQLILRTFHTSGAAITKDTGDGIIDMHQKDIISDLSIITTLLHKFKGKTYKEITDELFEVYTENQDILHIHFECVVSQLMWFEHKKWRLYKNRNEIVPKYFSVQSVPSNESWILGLAFSNPKRHILKGILHRGNYKGVIDKILLGERI